MAANDDINKQDKCNKESTETEVDNDDVSPLDFFSSLGLMHHESNQQSTIETPREDDFEVSDPSIEFFHSLGLQTNPQVGNNQNNQQNFERGNTTEENLLAQLVESNDNQDIDNTDVSLQFFHSLGLQTLQEASKRVDPNKSAKETSSDETENTNELYDTLWSSVNADISFVDSLGLYWLPHSIDGNRDSLSNQIRTTDQSKDETVADINQIGECVNSPDQTVDSKHDINDLDDCLNFFGFGSKTEVSGKQRWRLWNPSADDPTGLEHDVDDDIACHLHDQGLALPLHKDADSSTLPTDEGTEDLIPQLKDQHPRKRKHESPSKDLYPYKLEKLREIENCEDEEIEKFRNKTASNSAYYCTDCKRSISSQKLLARHLKSELHAKSCSVSLTTSVKNKAVQSVRDNEEIENNHNLNKQIKENLHDSCINNSDQVDASFNSASDTTTKDDKSENVVLESVKDGVADGLIDCLSCGAKVQPHQLGKHLISHFHYHRSIGHEKEKSLILENISPIVHQSPYQCQPCKFYCNWHRDLKEHVKTHHLKNSEMRENTESDETCKKYSVFWCQVCIKILPSNNDLLNHLESDDHKDLISVINRSIPTVLQKIDLVACNICDQQFRLNIGLKKHMLYVHGLTDFQLENHQLIKCQFCLFSSYKQKAVETHQYLVHREQRLEYTCNICRQSFASNEEIKTHRNSLEHKESVFKLKNPDFGKVCEFCWQNFPSGISELKSHLESEHLSILPQCNICGQLFYFSQQLKGHIKSGCRIESGLGRPANCSFTCSNYQDCTFSTNSEWRLLRHLRIKHRERPDHKADIKCSQCYRKFFCTEQLVNHVKKFHKEDEIFSCTEFGCHYQSNKQKLVQLHVKRAHTLNDKKTTFSCSLCDLKYQSKSALKNHMHTTHDDNGKEIKFSCDVASCQAKFMYKSDLERHKVKHDIDKFFSCEMCNFSTKRKSDLMRHVRLKHDENGFPTLLCQYCDYQTKNASHMKRHRVAKHEGNVDSGNTVMNVFQNIEPDKVLIVKLEEMVGINVQEVDV